MYDIIRIKADHKKFGFEKFYDYKSVQKFILICDNLASAAKNRNSKSLIMLKELDFDLGSLKLLAEKKKACLLFDLYKIINSRGIRRSIEMAKMRTALKYCNKYGVLYSFASFSDTEPSIRNSYELVQVCKLLGLNDGQAKFALKVVSHYITA